MSWNVKNYRVLDLPDFNLEEVNKHLTELIDSADIIFCLEVFEYVLNCGMALSNIQQLLKPGGKAYVTFAFAYPHHNELEMDSLRYTEPGIRRLAKLVGLTINDIWYRRDLSGYLQAFYKADGMRAAREYPHHDVTGFIVEFEK